VLSSFRENGFGQIFVRHNEHFIPLFFLFYFLETLIFGEQYLCYQFFSVIILAANALLVASITEQIAGSAFKTANVLMAFFYLISALHSESIQWAICQSALLGVFCLLFGMRLACKYLDEGKVQTLVFLLISSFAAPLFSAWGFLFIFTIPLLAFLFQVASGKKTGRLAKVCGACVVVLVIDLLLYSFVEDGVGHGVQHLRFAGLGRSLQFSLFGAQFGTLVRGLGLYPYLSFEIFENYFQSASAALWTAIACGGLLSIGLFVYYVKSEESRKTRLFLWGIGQVLIIVPFLMSSMARANMGLEIALTLRYQSVSLFGLCILLIPVVDDFLRKWCTSKSSVFSFGGFVLFVFVSLQLNFSSNIDRFSTFGHYMRRYFLALEDWNERIGRQGATSSVEFEGDGTAWQGQVPLLYGGDTKDVAAFTPVVHPDILIQVRQMLKGEKQE